MEALIESKQNCNLRIINIGKWGSPVAKQFEIKRLPALFLFKGKDKISQDTRDVLKQVGKLPAR